jgi:phenylalanyl-tRNA synthetase beta chain
MGAASAEVDETTQRVLLECAYFDPAAIARTGKRLALTSEARTRFERGVDPEVAERALERFVGLLRCLPGGEGVRFGRSAEFRDETHLPAAPLVTLRSERVNSLLGTSLSDAEIAGLLGPLGFSVEATGPGNAQVSVPTWRLECSREVDLVEEVARMWGYRRIKRTLPALLKRSGIPRSEIALQRRRVRQILCGAGFDEAWTTTFLAAEDLERSALSAEAVQVENPLDACESILRPSLLPGLLKALRFNVDRQMGDLALFEVGRVFGLPEDDATVPVEEERLGLAVLAAKGAGPTAAVEAAVRTWVLLADSLRIDAPALEATPLRGLHSGRCAVVSASKSIVGSVGEVAAEVALAYGLGERVGWLELSLDALVRAPRIEFRASEVSRYPAADIDLAFIVPQSLAAGDLAASLRSAPGLAAHPEKANLKKTKDGVVEDVVLFDVYHSATLGEGNRGLTFRVRLRAPDRTLRDDEIAQVRQSMIDGAGNLGAVLRS